nr:DUF2256 domain-containing protein [uncultured Hoeflea sp.]
MAKHIANSEPPQKPCACCGRPIAWRRKWSRDWEAVKYRFRRCRTRSRRVPPAETRTGSKA